MTVFERIKNNKQWPMEIHSPLCDNAKLELSTNPLYPLKVTDEYNVKLVTLTKNGTYTETLGGECLISPIDVPSWEHVYFPNVGDYITINDGNKTTIVYVTKVNPLYFNGYEIEINPGFKRINKVIYTYIAEEFKYNKAFKKIQNYLIQY